MGRYSAGASFSGINTANSAYCSIRNNISTARKAVVKLTIGIAVAPSTAPLFYLVRTTGNGTETTTLAGQPYDSGDPASTALFVSVWSAQPTFTAANKMDTGGMALTAGGQWLWTFYDRPIILPAATTGGLAIVNQNASGATVGTFVASAVWDE